jgi:acyl-CoA synthetase (AMP-forming)/AMP-acid ligase II
MIPYRELKKSAERWGDRTAFVVDPQAEVSFAHLWDRAQRLAGALEKAGIGKGDVIATVLPNGIELVELFLAAGAMGAVFQPLDIRFKGKELEYALTHTGTKVLGVHESGLEAVKTDLPDVQLKLVVGRGTEGWVPYETFVDSGVSPTSVADVDEDEDNAVFLFTSGTTGSLKCVPMTWRHLDHFPSDMVDRVGITPEDRGITLIPMSHISGPIIVSTVVSVGCSFVVTQRWRPDILVDLFERHRVTWTHTVPALADLLLKGGPSGRDLSSVRFIALMGTTAPVITLEELERAIPSCKAIQGYGLTETSPLLTLMDLDSHLDKRGSMGSAVGDVEIRVVDRDGRDTAAGEPGELVVRGPKVFSGYVGDPELTASVFEGDWFHTGDVVRVDTDGYYFHLGRLDDVINTGGLMVYPAEVEGALLTHPGIEEVVAYGVPDEQRGYAVAADVRLAEGAKLNKVDLQKFLGGRLADYKIPRNIAFVDEIGRTATGKPIRRTQQ